MSNYKSLNNSGLSRKWVCFAILLSPIWAYLLGGCDFYFDEERYETVKVSPERLGEIEALDLEEMSQGAMPGDANELGVVAAAEKLAVTVEECRAIALENNLGLKVQLWILSRRISRRRWN